MSGSGSSCTLNFGHILKNSGTYTANWVVLNAQLDATFRYGLNGNYAVGSVTDFTLGGFNSFSGIGPGSSQTGLQVSFDSNANYGAFADSLTLHPA